MNEIKAVKCYIDYQSRRTTAGQVRDATITFPDGVKVKGKIVYREIRGLGHYDDEGYISGYSERYLFKVEEVQGTPQPDTIYYFVWHRKWVTPHDIKIKVFGGDEK